jgi:aspartate racemase
MHEVSQRLVTQRLNFGYPPLVVYYCRHAPVLLNDDETPRLPIQPDPRLLEAARQLGGMCDFLVITSNTPHLLQADIERAAGCKVLSMIGLVIDKIRSLEWKTIGVLGFGYPHVYAEVFNMESMHLETVSDQTASKLDEAVRKVMEGRLDDQCTETAQNAVEELRSRNVDGIVLGCSEIPLMLANSADRPDLINPLQLLAESAVSYAIS